MIGTFFGVNVDLASLLLRLGIGILFIIHGYPKLTSNRATVAGWMKSMGLPTGLGMFAAIVEFLGGLALVLGIFTPIIAALFVPYMLATTWVQIKMKKGYVGGYELDITLSIASLALASIGSGAFSIDGLLGL